MKTYYIYMITNKSNKVLYTGVTNNLERRISEHKSKMIPGFSSRYNLTKLVYYDSFQDVKDALEQEKRIKGWVRKKKNALIETINPNWNDLSP